MLFTQSLNKSNMLFAQKVKNLKVVGGVSENSLCQHGWPSALSVNRQYLWQKNIHFCPYMAKILLSQSLAIKKIA